jgi:hypothetical protein
MCPGKPGGVITLGNYGRAHEQPAFHKLLLNALDWVRAGKP